jgi:tetratricopeptide (TPR) repeat protein
MGADRVVRVFLSSTFEDMFAEREELVRRAFTQLRVFCEARGVTCIEIDLRWGITEADVTQNLALSLCLREASRAHIFVGLLGERYGSIATSVRVEPADWRPWMAEAAKVERSYTEWEILYGVLELPGRKGDAYFYFRDPAFSAKVPAERLEAYCEGSAVRAAQLEALKARIHREGYRCRDNYPDPASAAEMIHCDLTEWIEAHYPADSAPGPAEREASAQRGFADLVRRLFLGRADDLLRLDRHEWAGGPPLAVVGEPGSGKSALLAEWAATRASRPKPGWRGWLGPSRDEVPAFVHFVAASPESADWVHLMRRLIGELSRLLGLPEESDDPPEALTPTLANRLEMAARQGRVVMVIDGLDQLDDRGPALDLDWLPEVIPANVRLVLSTTGGRTLDAIHRRGWETHVLGPLDPRARRDVAASFFASFGKKTDAARLDEMVAARQSANPLFLRTVMEELRILGDRKQLPEMIASLLRSATIEDLYGRVFHRWESDYERGCEGLVGHALRLLATSRYGLSEPELLDLLGPLLGGTPGVPLARLHWAPLAAVLEPNLIDHSGLLSLANGAIRQAARRRYLPDEVSQREAHATLAAYFRARARTPRTVEELPWHLARSGAWAELAKALADPAFLRVAWDTRPFEVRSLWAELEASSPHRMVDAYRSVSNDPRAGPAISWPVAMLLNEAGHRAEALALAGRIAREGENVGDERQLRNGLSALAIVARSSGRLDLALSLLERHARLCSEDGSPEAWAANLINRGAVHLDRGEPDRAAECLAAAVEVCRARGLWRLLASALGNQALVARHRGDRAGELRLLREQEAIARRSGDLGGLHHSLSNQATLRLKSGDRRSALSHLAEAEALCRRLGDRGALMVCLSNRAMALAASADFDAALPLLDEKIGLARALGDGAALADALADKGWIVGAQLGMPGPAVRLLIEAAGIAATLDMPTLTEKIASLTREVRRAGGREGV